MHYTIKKNKMNRKIKFDIKYTASDFIEANMGFFGQLYLESFPHFAHKINDWDDEALYDYFLDNHKELLIEMMQECYFLWLEENYF